MRARVLVWMALAVALLCAVFSFWQLENLPTEKQSGLLTAEIAEVDEDRLLLTNCALDGEEIEGNVLLYSEPCGCLLRRGMRVEIQAELEPLHAPVNPHGWDDRTWFVYKEAVYTCDGALSAHSAEAPYSLRESARERMLAHMDALWQGEEGGVICALLLGEENGVSEETQDAFRRSGAAHLMAVSGLHVGFVAALVLFVLGWMRRNSFGQLMGILVCMGLYALVAESAFSVFRAMVMLLAAHTAGCFGRRADGAVSLSLAVLAALVMQPLEIMRAGFLMSVCSVAGILLLCERLDQVMKKLIRVKWLRGSIAVSLSAQLGVLPVQLAVFATFNVLSLLTNLAAVPLAAGIVVLGLPTVLLHMVCPAAAEVMGAVVAFLTKVLMLLCEAVAQIPFAQLRVDTPPLLVLLSFMGILFLCSPYFTEYGKRGRIAWAAGILSLAVLSTALWLPEKLSEPKDKAVFLSVGTADCAVLQTEEGCVLVDTGWSGSQAVRYVQGEGRVLDAVILTHADKDHAGGLQKVLESVEVGAVYVPKGMDFAGMEDAAAAAQERNVPIVELCAGDALEVGAYRITVLSPEEVRPGKENEDSLVLDVMHGEVRMLLMGDVTAETEEALPLPDCDILKVPHHGSATATSKALLRMAQPEAAIISVGEENRYGFPREEVLQRLEEHGARVWRTDEAGAVTVVFTEGGYDVTGMADVR